MAGGGGGSVEIPKYDKPNASSFSLFGNTAGKSGDAWNYSTSGIDASTMNQAKQIRNQLMGALGVQDQGSAQVYQNTLLKELLRSAQPTLENSLIGRGLGRSTVYTNALNDLISKGVTQSILGRQQYQGNEQSLQLNQLNALQNYLQQENQTGSNLLNLASGYDTNQQQLAQQLYNTQLPYLAKAKKKGNLGGAGTLAGMLGALALAPMTGGLSLTALAAGGMLGGSAGSLIEV